MDASKVQKLVAKHLEEMRDGLGLVHWNVRVETKALDEGKYGTCRPMPGYNKATIELDPAQHETEADVLDTVRHELLHIFNAELWLLWDTIESLCGEEVSKQLKPLIFHVAESNVRRIERLLPDA